ncbi:MAG: hypothetical protein P4L45_04205 [Ignavibacteriaceae bacterium]|nr:hypothetical protein [Ignavibacteriaceae bacterium]
MSALMIKADPKSNKILSALAKKLGGSVLPIRDEQFEDLALGSMMDKVKTTETVSRKEVIKKLRK